MGFANGAYATVWDVQQGRGNFVKIRLSTRRKNKQTGEYEQDFSGFCMCVGNAKAKAEKLREKDRIKLGEVSVTTNYDKEKNKEYINFNIFDFEPQAPYDGGQSGAPSSATSDNEADGSDNDAEENSPF